MMGRYFSDIIAPVLITIVLSSSILVNLTQAQKSNPFQSSLNPSFQTSATQSCSNLPISSVTASGTQSGLSPFNIVDGDVTTRWSNLGLNSWVQVDLGKQMTICSIDISWYRGNERINNFIISGSNDGVNFVTIFLGKSNGVTSDFEKYDINGAKAKFIRITVTANSQNNWISISEIRVNGYETSSDIIPPTIMSINPANGATTFPITSVVYATFSEPMLSASLSSSTFTLRASGSSSDVLGSRWLVGGEGGVITVFMPKSLLSPSTTYVAKITTGIKDLASNSLSKTVTWSFTTAPAEATPPKVISTSPVSAATNVPVTSPITATFNEPMAYRFLTASTFTLRASGSSSDVSGSRFLVGGDGGKTAAFVPSSNLGAGTTYVATLTTGVKDQGGNSLSTPKSWSFTTPGSGGSTPDYNFAAVGDWSCNSRASETIANMQDKKPELIFALGDFSYKSSPNCWFDKIKDIEGITRITIGNHDAEEEESSALEEKYLERFNLDKPFYSFDYKNIHFLLLSSQLDAKKGDDQYNFANNDLNKASQNKNIKWIIVALHKPLYTSPTKHSAETDFRNVFHPLFDKYGVDLVLQAHNHNYQRSFPLSYNTQKSSSPIINDKSNSAYNDPKGPVFVIAGTGGKSLYDFKGKSSFIVTQQEEYGMFEAKITNGGSKLTGTFYANDGNQVEDTFTILK